MNERIRQLAEQANELDYETFDEYNHKTVQHYKFNKEKFAELIVRQCLTKIENEAAQYAEPVWAFELVNDIKEHFGVKE